MVKKKIFPVYLLISLFLIGAFNAVAQNPGWEWVHQLTGEQTDRFGAIATDLNNNLYVVGDFQSTSVMLGADTLYNIPSGNSFIAKHDAQGNVLWFKRTQNGGAGKVITDDFGNFYVLGGFHDSIILDNDTLRNSGLNHAMFYVAKYTTNGNLLWANSWYSWYPNLNYNSLTVDTFGNVYLAGEFRNWMCIGNDTLTSKGGYDVFLAKYDKNGNYTWSERAGGVSDDLGTYLTHDHSGNFYLTGEVQSDSVAFGNKSLNHHGMYILQFDSNGNSLWLKGANGNPHAEGDAISFVGDDIYLSGSYFGGSVSFGNYTLPGQEGQFLAKYNSAGGLDWVKPTPGGFLYLYNAVNNKGNIVVAGGFHGLYVTFGSDTLFDSNLYCIFLSEYDTAGALLNIWGPAGYSDIFIRGFAVDLSGGTYLAGIFDHYYMNFGTDTLWNNHNLALTKTDGFLAKHSDNLVSTVPQVNKPNASFGLFPNPCSTSLFVTTNESNSNSSYAIYDLSGRRILNGILVANNINSVDVSLLLPGMYLFKLTNGEKSTTQKIAVQK